MDFPGGEIEFTGGPPGTPCLVSFMCVLRALRDGNVSRQHTHLRTSLVPPELCASHCACQGEPAPEPIEKI